MDAITRRAGLKVGPDNDLGEGAPIGFREFVALTAAVIAMGALGIDTMLPALPELARSLGVAEENQRQFVVSVFLLGFGIGQLIHGPLADRYGRRRVMIGSLLGYVVANLACAAAVSFPMLLTARLLGGIAIAASRVVPIAIVRDCFSGRSMARVMSTAFIVFMIVPVIAPTLGEVILRFADWRAIFAAIAAGAAAVCVWFAWRMPETQPPEDRHPLSLPRIWNDWRRTFLDRLSLGYMVAAAAMQGGMIGYLNSIQQIVGESFGRPTMLAALFAGTAGTMALANYLNSRAVMRYGQRVLAHGAVCVLMAIASVHLLVNGFGHESLLQFAVFQALILACFGLIGTNFSSMAMSNMGPIAGTAASVQGFVQVTGGSLMGAVIGQAYDGTPRPMIAGFLFAGALALALAAITERGRLFRPA